MAENKNFDPLAALMEQQKAVEMGEDPTTVKSTLDELKDETTSTEEVSDIDYGDGDLDAEIAAEEAAEQEARAAKAAAMIAEREAKEAARPMMPPDERDMKYHDGAVDFQSEKLNIVSGMVNRVVAKYRLISGGIPNDPVQNDKGEIVSYGRMPVMGELIDIFHNNGEKITEDFEKIVLRNWVMPDGSRAIDNINKDGIVVDKTLFKELKEEAAADDKKSDASTADSSSNETTDTVEETKPVVTPTPTINIEVDKEIQKENPVEINIDGDVVAHMGNGKEVNVVVREVSEEELLKATVYKNSEKTGIINPYDYGINDVPVTLPLSGYRCTMRSVNWFDFISLTAPSGNNSTDAELKKWSVIYKHLKNPSIGDFDSFEDFLKKTKYQDKELLMWAILVATSDDEEVISITCGNPNCRKPIRIPYHPRNITKTDKNLEPKWYEKAKVAAPGDEAKAVWEEANNRRTRYVLPHSKIIVEISEPSAYDFINNKLKLVNELYKRYRPNDANMQNFNVDDLSMVEFDYLSANALYVESLTIIPRDENGEPIRDKKTGKIEEYAFTNWDKIEEIITQSLDGEDSATLLKVIQETQEKVSPISFRVENIVCPECGRVEPFIPIDDIGTTLLFQLSRRFGDIKINLTKLEEK